MYESLHYIMTLIGGFMSKTCGSIGWMPEYELYGIKKNVIYEKKMKVSK